ncbi:hypothetical protein GCM10009609_60750 [Pseudonocardia aurantiaca]|uniref:Uncharacterized protein n=1 Tax=Pseudonocardia aurantiaca TaxID=75290 RepID=A0ABW4FFC6_9PSEU
MEMDELLTFLLLRFALIAGVVLLVIAAVVVAVVLLRRAGRLDEASRYVAPVVRRSAANRRGAVGLAGRAAAQYLDSRNDRDRDRDGR